ncbi:DUF2069 domain-containing protein [Luteimonas sp. SJ-92]|uniref:DUF2069 domain-containing protein n=1 Tax=Luteimonas salinisoli TaxID=2752307 RepID=A0A853JCU7_9GAMM|nr:DUF2069 domain-containing protein [Luteimonas salinisoli]NZA26665.1 DUF2069 domain-containing protein [Luteimonas salinisoli]
MSARWPGPRLPLAAALAALAALFAVRYLGGGHLAAAILVFVGPPLLLMTLVLRGSARAAFWSGVGGLLWFSHGVMDAWSLPQARLLAGIEIALALAVIAAASWPGLSTRFARRR